MVQWFQSSGHPCTATTSTWLSTHCRCMLRLNYGWIAESPPSTLRTRECSARIASDARFTIPANMLQPWSIVKSQCERLFGSFQSITASTTRVSPFADVHFVFGVFHNLETGAAQHRLGARAIGN